MSNNENLGKQLNKIDANKNAQLEAQEIDNFLLDEKKVQRLGTIMQEVFGDESGKLQAYKENVGKICERILQNDHINLNQGKILFFYLKHFHNEDVGVGRNIIETIVSGSKGNRYTELISNMANGDGGDQDQQSMEERFNNLPGYRQIKEGRENSERCRQLLESTTLSLQEIQRLNEYKGRGNLDSEIINQINEKIEVANLEICNGLIENIGILSVERIQWLNEYKESLDPNSQQELINKIDERLKLENDDQAILGDVYAQIDNDPLGNIEVICPGLSNEIPNWEVIMQNIKPEDIGEGETMDTIVGKVASSITSENISQYLAIPEGISEDDKRYITNNFQNILALHLYLHPGYKKCWGENPDADSIGLNLENMVKEDALFQSALLKLNDLSGGDATTFDKLPDAKKNQQLDEVFNENNHILFDLRLKKQIVSCEQDRLSYVVAYAMYYARTKTDSSRKLNEFVEKNGFVRNMYGEYRKAKKNAEKDEREKKEKDRIKDEVEGYIKDTKLIKIPNNIIDIFNGESSFRMLSRIQIDQFKDYYDSIKGQRGNDDNYETFCELYEYSKNFYESEWVKNLALPNCLEAQDYVDFMASFKNMEDEVKKIEQEAEEMKNFNRKYGDADSFDIDRTSYHYSQQKKLSQLTAVRKYVELWQKSTGSYRPPSFLGIPLKWKDRKGRKLTNPEEIIRDTTLEGLRDKVRSFRENLTGGCYQQAFGDLVGLGTGLALSSVTLSFTGSSALSGAAFYLGSKFGNATGQMVRDLTVDGLGKRVIGLGEESGANKFDGLNASAGLGLGMYKRDSNGDVVRATTQGEWIVDTLFGTLASAATFQMAGNAGITLQANPFKYACIDEFISKPISNTLATGFKSAVGTQNYKGISSLEAMGNQLTQESSRQGLGKKFENILVVTAMVKGMNAFKTSNVGLKIDSKLKEVNDFLAEKGNLKLNDLKSLPEKELMNLMKNGLGGLINNLSTAATEGWNAVVVPAIPLALNGLLCETASPKEVLRKKIIAIDDKLRTPGISQKDMERYSMLRQRCEKLNIYLRDMSNINVKNTGEMYDYMRSHGLGDFTQSGDVELLAQADLDGTAPMTTTRPNEGVPQPGGEPNTTPGRSSMGEGGLVDPQESMGGTLGGTDA